MNPADLQLPSRGDDSPSVKTLSLAQKQMKTGVPRVDLEPIYIALRNALGDKWNEYKTAVSAFVSGQLSQAELSWVLHPLLSPAPSVITSTNPALSPVSTLHLHNTLTTAIYANAQRDPPPVDVAPWVTDTDKPIASKGASAGANDKAHERLKKEVMALHLRDRQRMKALKESGRHTSGLAEMQEYRNELLGVKSVDSTSGKSWDIDIRRRYAQTLASESLEFPSSGDIQNRIEPICHEEGLSGGVASGAIQNIADLIGSAAEVFLKELLGEITSLTRTNGEGSVLTAAYKKQHRREEDEADRGVLSRNPAGLLPCQLDVMHKRGHTPLDIVDLQLSMGLHAHWLQPDAFLRERVGRGDLWHETESMPYPTKTDVEMADSGIDVLMNGVDEDTGAKEGVLDPAAYWQGAGRWDKDELMGVLDDCLVV